MRFSASRTFLVVLPSNGESDIALTPVANAGHVNAARARCARCECFVVPMQTVRTRRRECFASALLAEKPASGTIASRALSFAHARCNLRRCRNKPTELLGQKDVGVGVLL